MRARDQLIGAVVLLIATAASIYRIAEARNEASAGAGVFRLDDSRREESEAFARLLARLSAMQRQTLADRLSELRSRGALWIAPNLGPGRWAIYVDSLSIVRRIYLRRVALLEPRQHLYPEGDASVPQAQQDAFARISLAGALYHELQHYDGVVDEGPAYDAEIAWYQALRASRWCAGLEGSQKDLYEWALDSAILSAEEARRRAVGGGAR